MEQQVGKKRRGRPLKEPEGDQTPSGQRRARVRQAQRAFRQRREENVTALRARIQILEDTVEEMSTIFIGLSDSILGSEYIRTQPQLITSIRDSVRRILSLVENASRPADEEAEDVEDDLENPRDESCALILCDPATDVPFASNQGEAARAARCSSIDEMGMQDFYEDPPFEAVPSTEVVMAQHDSVPENVRRMLTQNTLFTEDFWTGHYTTTTSMHMLERPNRPLPFWESLLRPKATTLIQWPTRDCLRRDADFCTSGMKARGCKYRLQCKSRAKLLTKTRWAMDGIAAYDIGPDATETGLTGPERMQADWRRCAGAYLNNKNLSTFEAAIIDSMVLAGYPVGNPSHAKRVESHVDKNGMVHVNDKGMAMALSVPPPSSQTSNMEHGTNKRAQAPATWTVAQPCRPQSNCRSRSSCSWQTRPRKKMANINTQHLVGQVMNLPMSASNGIEYPRQGFTSTVVAFIAATGN